MVLSLNVTKNLPAAALTHCTRAYIENTRLVLNIAQVYPASLRKSKITRLAE